MAKTNPLDAFVKGTTTNDFRLRPMPKLSDFVQQHGLMMGIEQHAHETQRWSDELVAAVNQRLQPKSASSPLGKAPAAAEPPKRAAASGDTSTQAGGGGSTTVVNQITNNTYQTVENVTQVSKDLANGATGGTVSGLGLGYVPSVYAVVAIPAGGLAIYPNVISGSESADGFDFVLSQATNSDGYILYAILAPQPTAPGIPGTGGITMTGAGGDDMTGAGGDALEGAGGD